MTTNVNLIYPNFTLTPQLGTFGTINTAQATTILRVKNETGGLNRDYVLSANMHPDNELIGIEYCGPLNLFEFIDGVTFVTVERIPDYDGTGNILSTSSKCIVKRWEIDTAFSLLNLKQQTVYYTTGNFHYDIRGMAVEHYNRTFDFHQPSGQNYLDINNASRIASGDILFLGVSTDTDNPGATEKVSVSHVTGNRVYLNGSTIYQYVFGDSITFFNNIYLISEIGFAGNTTQGTIFKHNVYSGYTGTNLEYINSGEYSRISGARWDTSSATLAGINKSQLLFINPYNSYLKLKSMFLTNITASNKDTFEVYDVVFDEFKVYKLMRKATTKNDVGAKSTESWPTYNFQQDSLIPYTHNVSIYMLQQHTIGADTTRIYVQTRDQFEVTLSNVNIDLEIDGGDIGAELVPLDGKAITDVNGKADIGYIPSGLYAGPTTVSVKADKSSPSATGSEFCWNFILIDSKLELVISVGEESGFMFQAGNTINGLTPEYGWSSLHSGRLNQLQTPFKVDAARREDMGSGGIQVPPAYITCYSHFGSPGGNWVSDGRSSSGCWPWFQLTPPREDGPRNDPNLGCGWDCVTYPQPPSEPELPPCNPAGFGPRVNFITQVLEFTQEGVPPNYYLTGGDLYDNARPLLLNQPLWFSQYYKNMTCSGDCELGDGQPVPQKLFQRYESAHDLQLSQLNLSLHSYWVDGVHTLNLETNVELNQFIFVTEAVPAFWSEKNPRETYIWIRMRPQISSLNGDTLKFYVREVWTADDIHYDTGYYDVVDLYGPPTEFNDLDEPSAGCTLNNPICFQYFDAGGGAFGLEFLYHPVEIFHHNTTVYIHIEIEDTAAEPNFIYTDYWFRVIPDFKSPYLENENPDREEDQVALDTQLYFEIKDDGEGIDINTLEVFLNSRLVYHAEHPYNPNTVVEEVNLNHYKVTIDLPYELQYGKDYSVGVRVKDISENRNILRDSYRFYTRNSEVPWFTAFDPKLCKRGMPRFRDVSFMVLGAGDGVDDQTIRIQVHDKDVTDKSTITPVIYRVS